MADYVKLKDEELRVDRRRKKKFNFKSIFWILVMLFILSSIISSVTYSLSPKIVIIPITGTIMTQDSSNFYSSEVSSREIANNLQTAGDDDSVKAVLLDINSPGGSPVASEEISYAIEKVKAKKPVYAVISDTGASGAFWVAVTADKVYASSMSVVGSIGVTSAGLGFENFLKEYNVTYRRQVAGEYKDMGTLFREPTKDEEKMMQALLDEIHMNFINHVAISRNMSYEKVEKYATGEIFLGSKAQEIGFIDKLGLYSDAIDDLINVTGTISPIIERYDPQPTLAEAFGLGSLFNFPKVKSQVLIT